MADSVAISTSSRRMLCTAWVFALLAFFTALCVLLLMQGHVSPQMDYAADDTYLDVVVAQNLSAQGHPGLGPATAIPATAGALWQVLLALGAKTMSAPLAVPCALAALVAALLIVRTRGLADAFQAGAWTASVALLVALASSLPAEVLGGSSLALATLLTTLMLERYLRGGARANWPLPLSAAWWAGLAALVQVELLVIWLALAVHAVVTGPLRHGRGKGLLFPLIRTVSGLLLVGLMLTPVLAWNMQTLSVPWPRFPDAPLSLDAWASQLPLAVFFTSVNLAVGVLGPCYAQALSVPILQGPLAMIFLLIGLGYTAMDAAQDRQRLAGTVGFALLLVPLLYAIVYPYVGWKAAASVFSALQPAWAVLMVIGVARSAGTLGQLIAKLNRRESPWLNTQWTTSVVVTVLVLMGCLRQIQAGSHRVHELATVQAARIQVSEALAAAPAEAFLASDQLGWLAYTQTGRFLDLTGRHTPQMLNFRTTDGWHAEQAASFLREQGVTHVITWSAAYAYAAAGLGCSVEAPMPRVCLVQ